MTNTHLSYPHWAVDTARCFSINPSTKEIHAETGNLTIPQHSKDSERFTFTISGTTIDGHDMTACNAAMIHFQNISQDLAQRSIGIYEVTDLTVDNGAVSLSWLIGEEATLHAGSLIFSIHFSCIAEDGTVVYNLPTLTYSRVTVGATIWNSDTIAKEYPDIIAQFNARVAALEAASAIIVKDKHGNLLPIEQSAASVESNGVKITYKDGVYTLNGTCTASKSFEIVPKGTEYAKLKQGVAYKLGYNILEGSYEGTRPALLVTAVDVSGNLIEYKDTVPGTALSYTADKNYTLNRFAISVTANATTNAVFHNLQIAPYLGTEFSDDYVGTTDIPQNEFFAETIDQLVDDVAILKEGDTRLPEAYVAERNKVLNAVQSEDADFRLITFADPHEFNALKYQKYNDLLASGCIDALVGLGDYQIYSYTGDKTGAIRKITEMLSYAGRTPNCFYAIGNHDAAYVSANTGAVDQSKVMTKKEMHDCFSRHLNGFAHFNEEDPYGGYYYVDYEAAKIRLVMLNTSDIYEPDGSLLYKYSASVMMQQPQITWLVDKALDFSEKKNWSVLVCFHANFEESTHNKGKPGMLDSILAAAKKGEDISETWTFTRRLANEKDTTEDESNPVTITVNKDFSVQGAIDVIGAFYGHDHKNNLLTPSGITFIEFISDTAKLDDYYVTSVENISGPATNILPIDQASSASYSGVNVTVTRENGIFTFNGTANNPKSFEIVPYTAAGPHTAYATLQAGVTYTLGMNVLGGVGVNVVDANKTAVGVFIKTKNADGAITTYEYWGSEITITPTEDCSLIRFALSVPKAGCTYDNYVVEPYLNWREESEGLKAGGYYITTTKGVKMGFTVPDDLPNAVKIGYSGYHAQFGGSAPIRVQNSDGTIVYYTAKPDKFKEGMIEITGCVKERVPGTISMESCSVVSINKADRTIKIVPYGTGIYREIAY